MAFSGYFLIVWDFIPFCQGEAEFRSDRGAASGAGSLVAYSVCITDIDPIVNKLLFERFLNSERVSMPDFDVDFCMNRRDEVIALRHREIRQEQRRPDRDHAPDEGAQLHPRRGPRHGSAWWPEQNRVATLIPEPVAGQVAAHQGGDREGAAPQVYEGSTASCSISR